MKMHWKMAMALALGVMLGIAFGKWYEVWGFVANGIGQVFLRAIGMIVVPLVFLSTVLGISNRDDSKSMGKMAIKTFAFFLGSSIVAAFLGIVVTDIVRPGIGVHSAEIATEQVIDNAVEPNWMDKIIEIVPNNIFATFNDGKILPIILFSLLFGFFVTKLSYNKRENINNLFEAFNDVILGITNFVIGFAPFGVFAIIMNLVGKQANDIEMLKESMLNIMNFVRVVWIALIIMGAVVLPFAVGLIARMSPIKHIKQIHKGLSLAFTTSSSYSAMPLLIKDTKEKVGVSNSVASFTIPLGITFNKVGTIIYECVAVIFIAQSAGVDIDAAHQAILIGMSIVTVLGAPSVPMAGVVVLAILLKTMGLPNDLVGMLMAVDILCDMPKTLLNAYSVGCGAVIVAKSEGEALSI